MKSARAQGFVTTCMDLSRMFASNSPYNLSERRRQPLLHHPRRAPYSLLHPRRALMQADGTRRELELCLERWTAGVANDRAKRGGWESTPSPQQLRRTATTIEERFPTVASTSLLQAYWVATYRRIA